MATLTITTTTENQDRAILAFTDRLNLVDGNGAPRDATGADIKTWLINHMKGVVHTYETRLANEAASSAITPIDPT